MYNKILLFIVVIICSYSCQDERELAISENPVDMMSAIKVFAASQENPIFYTSLITSPDSLSRFSLNKRTKSNVTYRTYEFFNINSNRAYLYPANILKGKSIETQTFSPLLNEVDPITINIYSPSFWISKDVQKVSFSAYSKALYNGLNEALEIKNISSSFVIDMNPFTYYDELKLAFGSDVNVKSLFRLDFNSNKITSKTGLILRFIKKNFSSEMSFPKDGNLLLNNSDIWNLNQYTPVYINSITYGSAGFLIIESEYNYEDVRDAVNTALGSIITTGKLQINSYQKHILNQSNTRVLIIDDSNSILSGNWGIEYFAENVINSGTFSRDSPGAPIFYTVRKLSDNSPFYNTFTIEME